MTNAILKLDGADRLEGQAEMGGDYVRLSVTTMEGRGGIEPSARGTIEIDGATSDVTLENVSPAPDGGTGVVLTLRLFTPIGKV